MSKNELRLGAGIYNIDNAMIAKRNEDGTYSEVAPLPSFSEYRVGVDSESADHMSGKLDEFTIFDTTLEKLPSLSFQFVMTQEIHDFFWGIHYRWLIRRYLRPRRWRLWRKDVQNRFGALDHYGMIYPQPYHPKLRKVGGKRLLHLR